MKHKELKKHIYKITVYRCLGFKKVFKIRGYENIDEIIKIIRDQADGNLITFCDLKDRFINFDRSSIDRIIVEEV